MGIQDVLKDRHRMLETMADINNTKETGMYLIALKESPSPKWNYSMMIVFNSAVGVREYTSQIFVKPTVNSMYYRGCYEDKWTEVELIGGREQP